MARFRRLYLGLPRGDRFYELGHLRSSWNPIWGFGDKGYITGFCRDDFEAVTGLRLEPGEVRKVRISVEVVG